MREAPFRSFRAGVTAVSLAAIVISAVVSEGVRAAPLEGEGVATATIGHLVVSEVMTGGASASDEFVELYNPSPTSLSLDGHELIYVTASGATVTRKAVWGAGALVGPGRHFLVANEAGIFAGIADLTYANGLAAGGGSLALRIIAAPSAIDAVGWGTAASTWLETTPAPAAPAGSSLERLPGGAQGSGQDTEHNLVDFVLRGSPDPQNSASPPVPVESPTPVATDSPPAGDSPSPVPSVGATPEMTPTPEPTATPVPTPSPTPPPTPTASPTPEPTPTTTMLSVAQARARPDGSSVTVGGVTLTASDFGEGGGYLADATGGIAVLVSDGSFAREVELVLHGTIDDRYGQRTIRVDGAGIIRGHRGAEPASLAMDTGSIGEAAEGRLVGVRGVVQGAPIDLAAGLAFEIDDGSGPIRIVVGPATGIDTSGWQTGVTLALTGIVGQRDSSGTGLEGYRVQPRDLEDIGSVLPPATPEPTPSPAATEPPAPTEPSSPTPRPTPSATPDPPGLVSVFAARRAEVGTTLRIRGVVTLPIGLVEEGSAVVADTSGPILVRGGSEIVGLRRGEVVELTGVRSTKSGMLSLRVTQPAVVLGSQAEPLALRRATGAIHEADEALLVVVRGLVRDGPQRTGGGGLSFTINDGSGPLRVSVAAGTGITSGHVPAGAWIELRGVVGQETTAAQATAGYRLWPRDRADVVVIARATGGTGETGGSGPETGTSTSGTTIPTTAPSASVTMIRPNLSGTVALAGLAGAGASAPEGSPAPFSPPAPVPLAACLAGLSGLLVLAWRHGTLGRLAAEAQLRMGREEEDESYTPAP